MRPRLPVMTEQKLHEVDVAYDGIAAVVRKLTWPPTAAGASVQIEYPFTFGLVRMPHGYKRDIGLELGF